MSFTKRSTVIGFLGACIVAGSLPFSSVQASTNTACKAPAGYPDGPVELIVRFGPGGGADVMARTVASIVEDKYPDFNINVRNVSGGNSLRAVEEFMSRPADGHTLINTDVTLVLAPLMGQTRHDIDSYVHLARANADSIVFAINPEEERFTTAEEMIDWAKGNPNQLRVSTTGVMSSLELNVRYFHTLAGYEARNIGYAKPGERRAAVMGGHMDVVAENLSSMVSTIESGNLKPILILSDERVEAYPDVPTAKELGIDYSWGQVRGLAAKPGLPEEVQTYLECVLLDALESDDYRDWEASRALPNPGGGVLSGSDWRAFLEMETQRQMKVLETFGLVD